MRRWSLGLLVAVALSAWAFLSVRADYFWSSGAIQAKEEEGWVVASTMANVVDLSRPWTVFAPTVTRIAFIRPAEVIWLEENHPAYRVLWVDRELGEDEFTNVADCPNGQSAFVADDALVELWSLKLEWRPQAPGTPGEDLVRFVCGLN